MLINVSWHKLTSADLICFSEKNLWFGKIWQLLAALDNARTARVDLQGSGGNVVIGPVSHSVDDPLQSLTPPEASNCESSDP